MNIHALWGKAKTELATVGPVMALGVVTFGGSIYAAISAQPISATILAVASAINANGCRRRLSNKVNSPPL